ncbi:MAG: alpha/beta hydrolase [Oscillospiraceae bacterium]|jgi:pimeloyl-ACP methyl ester carboxylesterase|nr:alpha/beta hydrolase [Oscillospiraceae bacterium]
MLCTIRGIPVYYEDYGEGRPVLFIHGWSVDHRLMSGCFEPVFEQTQDYRRIYIDMPGMGKTPAADWMKNSDTMIELLREFVGIVIGDSNFLLVGESYGGYVSLGLIHEMRQRIDGLFLLCPLTDSFDAVNRPECLPKHQVLWRNESWASAENDPDATSFLDMAAIATPEIFAKYKRDILPAVRMADWEHLNHNYKGEYHPDMEKALRTMTFDKPSCILTGRQDHAVGYQKPYELVERFPRATFAALDCAGHNLQLDNEPLFRQMVKDWLWRVEKCGR